MRAAALLLAILLTAPPALAATGVPALDFAAHLSPIEPALAALEYERFLGLNPDHPLAGTTREHLVDLYLRQKDFLRAQRHLVTLRDHADPKARWRWTLKLGQIQAIKGWPELARATYEEAAREPNGMTTALRHLLWLEIRQRRWEEAMRAASRLPQDARTRALIERLGAWQERPARSVDHAQRLSALLPGSGQIYAGDWGSGLASFTLNAAWIGLLSYAVRERDWLGGLLVANYGPRYYLGGIQTAGNLVSKELLGQDRAFIQALEADFADLLPAGR